MSKLQDLTGQKYGYLTALRRGPNRERPNGSSHVTWECLCDCGRITCVTSTKLRSGKTKSCGCQSSHLRSEHLKVHGMTNTPVHEVWQHMISRCEKTYDTSYPYYGGRGIKVCDRWKSFVNFWEDMGETYRAGLQLERIDNDGNYEPGNCRWATRKEQARNRSNTVWVDVFPFGTIRLVELAERTGLSYQLLHGRLRHGRPLLTPDEKAQLVQIL